MPDSRSVEKRPILGGGRQPVVVGNSASDPTVPVSGTVTVDEITGIVTIGDYMLEVPAGNIVNKKALNKFGRAPLGVQTTETDIWDRADATPTQQIWVAPTAARIHTIQSSSVNDTTGGTGANSVEVFYLPDWDTAEQSETVTGNLNAGIAMTNAAVIIHRMRVIPQATSTTINDGTITATAAAPDSTVTAQINIGEGQTQMAIYGIPSVQSLYLTQWYGTVNRAQAQAVSVTFSLFVNPSPDINTVVYQIKNTRGLQSTGQSSDVWPWKPYFRVNGPAIIKVNCISSQADTEASAGLDGILVTN